MAVDDSAVNTSLDGTRQQFQQQIDFFRQKLNLPTERWDDIRAAAHDRAFMVAGAQKADLLNDLRKAVDKSVNGQSIGEFRKDFAAATAKSGWSGWTGEGTKAGEAWRTRVIYQTNVATSYAAGRWKQLNDPDLKAARPFWKYIHADGVIHPRPLHKAWGDAGLTLPSDHPFWRTHFPPNGWGCGCRVKAVRLPRGNDATSPPDGWDTMDEKTGAPLGIDKGWGYAPGANADTSLRKLVQEKLVTYPDAITKALSADIRKYINASQSVEDFVRATLAGEKAQEVLWLGFVENFESISPVAGVDVKGFTVLLPSDSLKHIKKHHEHDGGSQRPAKPQDYTNLLLVLNEAESIRKGDLVKDLQRIVVAKKIDQESFVAVFEVRPGAASKSLALKTLVIKQPEK